MSLASLSSGILWSGIWKKFCNRKKKDRRKLRCPGIRLKDVIHKVENIVKVATKESVVVVQAGMSMV